MSWGQIEITIGILVATIVILYWKFVKASSRVTTMFLKFPGPPTIPILGNALEIFVPNHELLNVMGRFIQAHGRTVRIWLANKPYILLAGAKEVETILTSNVFINKALDYSILEPWLGTGLLTSKGQKWFTRRKFLTPTFHFKILEDFVDVFNEQSAILVNLLDDKAVGGETIDICHFITNCALDIICETAMGKTSNAQTQNDSEYVQAVYGVGDILVQRLTRPWLRPYLIWKFSSQGRKETKYLKILHKFTEKVIAEKKEFRLLQRKTSTQSETSDETTLIGQKKRVAFLDLLLDISENGKILTDLDIREETDTFMFEGHDTTSAALGWIIYLLSSHPEAQAKVQEELDAIFGEDKERAVTMKDMTQMQYLECCIKESLRIYPSVPAIARNIFKDLDLGDGRTIPAGTDVFIFPYWLHRDPTVFPDPENFLPERWLDQSAVRNPCAYIPFSAGARNCIGQKFAMLEEKVILSQIFRRFNVHAMLKNPVSVPDIILRARDGILVKLSRR